MPAPTQDIRIEGLRQLEQNLNALADEYGPKNAINALRAPLRDALRPLEAHIRRNTPIDTGALRDSTSIRINLPTRRLLQGKFVNNTSVIIGRVGWFWRRGQSLWDQALSTEYGNRTTPAQPTIRPAFNALAERAALDFGAGIAASIEATAERLYQRNSAGTLRRR